MLQSLRDMYIYLIMKFGSPWHLPQCAKVWSLIVKMLSKKFLQVFPQFEWLLKRMAHLLFILHSIGRCGPLPFFPTPRGLGSLNTKIRYLFMYWPNSFMSMKIFTFKNIPYSFVSMDGFQMVSSFLNSFSHPLLSKSWL